MPWQETDPLKQRVKCLPNAVALCRASGITRQCGQKWTGRYRDADYDLAAVHLLPCAHGPSHAGRTRSQLSSIDTAIWAWLYSRATRRRT